MQQDTVKLRNSLVTRFGLVFLGLIVLAISITGYLVYSQSEAVITQYGKDRIEHTSGLAMRSISAFFDEISRDVTKLSENENIREFVNSPTQQNSEKLGDFFTTILESNSAYLQIRLLTADQGKELVRVDRTRQGILKIAPEDLQFVENKPYLKESLSAIKGKLNFSAIDLFEESGTVSVPFTPTIRAATPLFNANGEIMGVLLIHLDISNLFSNLFQTMPLGIDVIVADEYGQYLFAPIKSKCFGEQRRTGESFSNDYNKNIREIAKNANQYETIHDLSDQTLICRLEEIPYALERKTYLVSISKEDTVRDSAALLKEKGVGAVLIVCFLTLGFALILIRVFALRITRITQAISQYDNPDFSAFKMNLHETRNDELGVLTRTFIKMNTQIHEQVDNLNTSLKKEQKAIKERDEFLQNMSHELRTPLNAILGLTQLLDKNNPLPEQKPIIESMTRSATNLAGLMYDILDHQKLIEGKVHINYLPCSIDELLSDIYTSYQFDAINKGLLFRLDSVPELKAGKYQMDSLRFTQIITNLVVNAIKYTNKGEIRLVASISGSDNQALQVSITDTGVGIQAENLKKINERFYREADEISGRYGGFGLGLSIVRQLVDLFGGKFEVTSTKDVGSTFTVTLPLVKVENAPLKGSANGARNVLPTLTNEYTILHIEDDLSAQEIIRHTLNTKKYHLIQKSTVAEATQYLEFNRPNLIISDLLIDNDSIGKNLESILQNTPTCPVLIISAFDKEQMQNYSPYYLQKPVDIYELSDMVVRLVGANEFDVPKLQRIYSQYDHDPKKISNYISILLKEFDTYRERIEKVYITKDEREWKAIVHKIVTHVRSLELQKLAACLPEKITTLDDFGFEYIKNSVLYFQCTLRSEMRSNSKG